ncbi:glycerophosphodiester phosphodiesterase family protein [Flavobacterium branchiarum]|uniref:Glycerophosphodiester phosphodiesterase n=1 Tax=Flavobacterium branchiarum TaxID=1114870 RepID=A0ABV5FR77_9FLAO|nr:glycerophosphodiester phosphodiesterase family protein [Flavobacterium branchiarum]MDN3671483.1 glycerophosphodiester phosphodiesterase family protein [Flavobacterium branchiarum]MDN3671591.1 glycerophosphodiester phosphodiesterase family protein [Flavobacterium branchiarum]
MLKIAHRGARGYEPENTLQAFQKAIQMKADGIELDVQLSSDGHLIVIHDETIDRTTNGKGFVNNLSLQELKDFRIENKHQIPTLSEVLDLVNQQCFINIELKGIGTADAVVTLIELYISEKNWSYDSFLVSSFDWEYLKQINSLNPKIAIGVLTETDIESAITFAKEIKAKAIHPDFHLLNKENTKQIQEIGFQVFPWTVNEKEDIAKIKTYNVNGIISDFTDRI